MNQPYIYINSLTGKAFRMCWLDEKLVRSYTNIAGLIKDERLDEAKLELRNLEKLGYAGDVDITFYQTIIDLLEDRKK